MTARISLQWTVSIFVSAFDTNPLAPEFELLQIILGCENQSEIDYSMPIRTMLYDALKYTEQQNNLELRKRKDGTYYHSKLRKDDKVLPVLTLIFYYGDKEWTA